MTEIAFLELISYDTNCLYVDGSFLSLEDFIMNICTQMLGDRNISVPESTMYYIHKDFAKFAKDFHMGTEDFFRIICAMCAKRDLLLEDLMPLVDIYRYKIEVREDNGADDYAIQRTEDYCKRVTQIILEYQQEDYEKILKTDKKEALNHLYRDIKYFLPEWKEKQRKYWTAKRFIGYEGYSCNYYEFSEIDPWYDYKTVCKRYKQPMYRTASNYLKREYFLPDLCTHAALNVLPFINADTKIKGNTVEEIILNIANSVRPDRYFVSVKTSALNIDFVKEVIRRIKEDELYIEDTGEYFAYFNVYNIYDVERIKGLNAYSLLAQIGNEIYIERALERQYQKVTDKVEVPKIKCYESYQKFCNANRVKNLEKKPFLKQKHRIKVNLTGEPETITVSDKDIYAEVRAKIKANNGKYEIHTQLGMEEIEEKDLYKIKKLHIKEDGYRIRG